MNPTTAPTQTGHLSMVATGAIETAGLNPREIDREGEEFAELRASIENRGILQPLLLRASDEDTYQVIAGHRRFAAAQDLAMEEVPALVVDLDDEGARIAAITENVQRQNMTPLEEARALAEIRDTMGLRLVDAVQVLGKSERWGRERLRLLDMPQVVVDAIDSGRVPLEATVHLQRLSEKAPQAAALLVEPAVDPETGEILEDEQANLTTAEAMYRSLLDLCRNPEAGLVRVSPRSDWNPMFVEEAALPLSKVQRARIDHASGGLQRLEFGTLDSDATRAYGCLLEIPGYDHVAWITDMEWLADRLVQIGERTAAQVEEEKARRAQEENEPEREETTEEMAAREKAEAEQAQAKERARERKAADGNLLANLEGMATPALGAEFAKAIVAGVLGVFEDYDLKGMGEHDERFKESPQAFLLGRLAEAKDPADIFAIAMRVLVWDVCELGSADYYGRKIWLDHQGDPGDPLVSTYIERWAMDSGLLTQLHRDEIEERWRQREEAARQAKEDEEDEQ